MGSQFLMSILKDSGIADIAVSIIDYLVGKKDEKRSAGCRSGERKSEARK